MLKSATRMSSDDGLVHASSTSAVFATTTDHRRAVGRADERGPRGGKSGLVLETRPEWTRRGCDRCSRPYEQRPRLHRHPVHGGREEPTRRERSRRSKGSNTQIPRLARIAPGGSRQSGGPLDPLSRPRCRGRQACTTSPASRRRRALTALPGAADLCGRTSGSDRPEVEAGFLGEE